jgi:hypothetical protein
MKALNVFLAAMFAVVSAASAAAQGADVIGTWNLSFNTGQGPIAAQMVLKKEADKVVGTITSEIGSAPVDAAVKDKELSVAFAMDAPGGSGQMNVVMNATIEGNSIKGTFSLDGQPGGDFAGSREAATPDAKDAAKDTKDAPKTPETKSDVTGTWAVQVITSEVSASPTVMLKQDGEKVTGQYVSAQYGQFPLTGTVKGNAIEFGFSMTIEGNAVNVAYSGTIEADAMKGNVNYGDLASGTFTASRKK